MEQTDKSRRFIKENLHADLTKLLLAAGKYPEIDMPFVVGQIAARRQIKDKLPSWYANDQLLFPSKLSAEQSSSEQTALYKQRLVNESDRVCDLTGGLGIDSFFFSRKVSQVIYMERFPKYCEVAKCNFGLLEADNIRIIQGDSTGQIATLPENEVTVFFIDPARRGKGNKRTYALSDCEPDLSLLLPCLFEKADKVIAKISPMVDIRQTLQLLPAITQIHILSVKNECKELVLVLEKDKEQTEPILTTWNIRTDGVEEVFTFTLEEENAYSIAYAADLHSYLFEPNSSVLKAGAFKIITRLGVEKLHPSSHLYTSKAFITDFPGRCFRIEEVIPFKGKEIKNLSKQYPQANITVRNFPLSVEELRKRTKIKEGGDIYLFATMLADDSKVLIRCRKV